MRFFPVGKLRAIRSCSMRVLPADELVTALTCGFGFSYPMGMGLCGVSPAGLAPRAYNSFALGHDNLA